MAPTLLVRGNLRGDPAAVPVEAITGWLRQRMPEFAAAPPEGPADRVLVVKSETGSGKSTVLPAAVFALLRGERAPPAAPYAGRTVLCTQPRVLTAETLARDMAASPHYPGLRLPTPRPGRPPTGGTVGYLTGPHSHSPPRGLVYATAGVLRAQLRDAALAGDFSPVADRYAFIIVDEAHERSLDVDATLMYLKLLLAEGFRAGGRAARQLPFVILASATINPDLYCHYFGVGDDNVFRVTGRQYPIEKRWPPVGTNDYAAAAVATATKLLAAAEADPARADVLIFVPGAYETHKITAALEKKRENGDFDPFGAVVVLAINRQVVVANEPAYALASAPGDALWDALAASGVYEPPGRLEGLRRAARGAPPRRVIVTTVVAETGVTLPAVKYVIDPGWSRGGETYQPYGVWGLLTRPAPQSRILQRMGRAGRLFPGVFCPLYTEKVFKALPPQQEPDVVTEGAGIFFLDLALAQEAAGQPTFDASSVDLLTPPPADAFAAAVEEVVALGFFTGRRPAAGLSGGNSEPRTSEEQGQGQERSAGTAEVSGTYGLTPLGRAAARFQRLSLQERRLLLSAPLWEVAAGDLATVVGLLAVGGLASLLDVKGPDRSDRVKVSELLLPVFAAALPAGLGATHAAAAAVRDREQNDLLVGLMVFEAFRAQAEKAVPGGGDFFAPLERWCEGWKLRLPALAQIATAREKALDELAGAGFNPFWGEGFRLAKAEKKGFAPRAAAFRRCLGDAYRLNTLAWDEAEQGYFTRHGVRVNVPPSSFAPGRPGLVAPALTLGQTLPSRRMVWAVTAPYLLPAETGMAGLLAPGGEG